MAETRGYRFLEHTTDAYIEAWGPDLEGAFSSAAEALFETMLDLSSIQPVLKEEIMVEGHDELELLYNWLETLLLRLDINGYAFSMFHVDPVSHSENSFKLHAIVSGEKFDRNKHGGKTEVKGVTYHLMRVEKRDALVSVRFILDL